MESEFVLFVSFIFAIFFLYYFSKLVVAVEKIADKLPGEVTVKKKILTDLQN